MLSVEDLLGRGGDAYGYRLEAKRQHPDFVADMITPFVNVPAGGTARISVLIQRRGYAGELRVKILNLPEGFKVAGGHVPVEAAQQNFKDDIPGRKTAVASLTITAPADAKPQSLELQLLAEAQTEDGPIRRYARGPGIITAVRGDKQKSFTAPWLGMKLPMAITDPPAAHHLGCHPLARFAQGFEFEMKYEVTRTAAAGKAPVKVTSATLGAVGNLRILKGGGKSQDKGSFLVDTNFATPFALFDMAFDLQTEVDGKPVTITSPIMEIEVVAGYQVRLARNQIELTPGGSMEIPGKHPPRADVRRRPGQIAGRRSAGPRDLRAGGSGGDRERIQAELLRRRDGEGRQLPDSDLVGGAGNGQESQSGLQDSRSDRDPADRQKQAGKQVGSHEKARNHSPHLDPSARESELRPRRGADPQ